MPTMRNRILHTILFLALAATAGAQYLPGKLQGGSGVPGTQSRSPLNSLERAANNLPGITIVTDTFGNQRLSYYVRVLDTCVNYNPLLTVGNLPISSFVYQCGDNDSLFYIDWKSDVVLISIGGGPSCDADWLDIVTNDCPDNINDSIYTQKYAAIGARLVWPTAELLVSDSAAVQVTVLSGNRNSRLGFWDNVNQFGSTIDQSGSQTLWYIEPTGEMRWATAGSGTVQAPGAPFVNQFAINPADAPLPTVQAHLYPNTRTDTNTIRNFIYTDGSGKLRSQSIDSLAQILIDSAFIVTIYSGDDTTASTLRTVHILESLQFTDLDAGGYFLVQMGSLAGGRALIDTAAAIYHSGLGGINIVQADAQGIDIATSATASRAVNLTTDTVNTQGSFDPQNFRLNFLSDYSYLYADSLKVVGIGQFPGFPSLNLDGTEKGILYDPSQSSGQGQVNILSGDGVSGEHITLGFYPKYAQMDMATSSNQIRYGLRVIGADANSTNRWLSLQTENDSLTIQEFNDEHYIVSSTDLQINVSDQLRFLADSAQWIEGTVQTETGMKFLYGSTPTGWMKRFDGSGSDGDFIVSDGDVWRISNATAEGYVLQNGNSFGAPMVIGTNDDNSLSFETNTVTRATVTSGATTGGAWTFTNVTANTNSASNIATMRTNSTGTALVGFGNALLFQGESSTTDNRDMGRISSVWTTATDATRTSKFTFQTVNSGAALATALDINPDYIQVQGTGILYGSSTISSSSSFTILGSSTSSSTAVVLSANGNNVNASGTIGNSNFTTTSGTKYDWRMSSSYSPTSGTGEFYNLYLNGSINQTGGANGNSGAIIFNPTLTALGGTWSALTMATSNSSAKFLNQTGANTTSTHVGAFGFGATTIPTDKVEVTGNLALLVAGNKLKIATGSNASVGTSAAMTAGSITISTTAVTANSQIFLTHASVGGTQGILSVGTITAGTSFVINSSNAADTGTVNWIIIN